MKLAVTNELVDLCQQIVAEDKLEEEWALIESDDMYQNRHFCGGFDADEMEFCFSYYLNDQEYWFQLPLSQVHSIAERRLAEINCRIAES